MEANCKNCQASGKLSELTLESDGYRYCDYCGSREYPTFTENLEVKYETVTGE